MTETKRVLIYAGLAVVTAGVLCGVIATLLNIPDSIAFLGSMVAGFGATIWAIDLAQRHHWRAP